MTTGVNGSVRSTAQGTYQARWRGPDGRERAKNFPTRATAKLHLASVQAAVVQGRYTDPRAGQETVAAYANYWIKHHHARPSTVSSYQHMLSRYVLPYLGKRKLADLDYDVLTRWVNDLKVQKNQRTGRPISASTVHGAHRVVKTMLATAVKTKRIPYNPARDIPLPPKVRPPWKIISAADLERVLDEMPNLMTRTLVLCAALTGMRWSELAGLKWKNVVLEKRVIRVRTTLVETSVLLDGTPKSERSQRDIPIPKRLAMALVELRVHYPSTDEGYVFRSERGCPLRHSNFHADYWVPARNRAGLAGLRLHDLRHGYATWLIENGADLITVRDLLGHESVITTQLYSHTEASRMRAAVERLFGDMDEPEERPADSAGPDTDGVPRGDR